MRVRWARGSLAQIQIEQDVVAKTEVAAWWAKRLVERLDRIESQGRPAGSDEERGHRDVQPIHEAGLQEAGDGDSPTLDENPPIPLVSKRLDDGSRIEAVGTGHR